MSILLGKPLLLCLFQHRHRRIEIAHEVLFAKQGQYAAAAQAGADLFVCPGDEDADAAFVEVGDDAFQGEDAGHVNVRHPAHTQDNGARLGVDVGEGFFEFFHRAEEEGTVDDEHLHVFRQRLTITAVLTFFDFNRLRHLSEEVQSGEDDADVDRDDKVHKDGEGEGDEKEGIVGARGAAQHVEAAFRLAHVPGDLEEDGGQRGERNVSGKRCGDQQDEDEGQRVDDSGKRAVAALTNVGRGAGDSAGRSKTAEEGGNDIGKPLTDEFLVGTVACAGHAVGDDCREQRFDSAEHGDGEGGQDEGGDFRPAEIRQGEGRQLLRRRPSR